MQKIQLEKSLSEGFIFYAISTLTIAIQFLFYLIHSPRLAMMDVGGWMFYITAACSHAALWALIPYIISLIVAITVRRHQAAAITHIILVSLLNILAYIDGSVYSLYKFHINGFVLNLLVGEGNSEIFTFSFWLYLKIAGVLVGIFAANTLLRILAGHCYTRFHRCGFRPILATLILFALFSNFYHAYAAVAQLRTLGEVGYLCSSIRTGNFKARGNGYREALHDFGLPEREELCFSVTPGLNAACEDMNRLLDAGRKLPPAFFADNDVIAIGAMRAMQAHGYQLPQDVNIIGVDNTMLSQICIPALSSIQISCAALGEQAIQLLLDQIADPSGEQLHIHIGSRFIARESTAGLNRSAEA